MIDDDLVERLRSTHAGYPPEVVAYRLREAADAVEGLVAENEQLRHERDKFRGLWARRSDQVAAVMAVCQEWRGEGIDLDMIIDYIDAALDT